MILVENMFCSKSGVQIPTGEVFFYLLFFLFIFEFTIAMLKPFFKEVDFKVYNTLTFLQILLNVSAF